MFILPKSNIHSFKTIINLNLNLKSLQPDRETDNRILDNMISADNVMQKSLPNSLLTKRFTIINWLFIFPWIKIQETSKNESKLTGLLVELGVFIFGNVAF